MMREFGIRTTRYVNYHWAVIDETDIHFLSNLAQKPSHLIPNSQKLDIYTQL